MTVIQERCQIINRAPPKQGRCGFCGKQFKGESCWDDYLEHVGKHLEGLEESQQQWKDEGLRAWMVSEGLLEQNRKGTQFGSLCGKKKGKGKESGSVDVTEYPPFFILGLWCCTGGREKGKRGWRKMRATRG